MKILVLNGSPRHDGQTSAMCAAFEEAAGRNGHDVTSVDVCSLDIHGCMACEACHREGSRVCIQQDDMQKIYPVLDETEMLVIASPIYYYSYSGQMQCVLNRIYALDKPEMLKKTALFLAAGAEGTFDGAVFAYYGNFPGYLKTEDMGIFTASEEEKNLADTAAAIQKMASEL